MFDRNTAQQISNMLNTGGDNLSRVENQSRAYRMLFQAVLTQMVSTTALWGRGVSDTVQGTPTPQEKVPGSQYSKRYWETMFATFETFMAYTQMSFAQLGSLAITDENGNIVLDANNNPIRPFAPFVAAVDPAYASDTPADIIWSDPEVGTEPETTGSEPTSPTA